MENRPDLETALEQQLQSSFRPVQPNPEFVSRLHSRLTRPSRTVLERQSSGAILLIITAGLVSLSVLLWGLYGLYRLWPGKRKNS